MVMQCINVIERHQSAQEMKAQVPSVRVFSAVAGEEAEHLHFH